jgi:hypothetical protein
MSSQTTSSLNCPHCSKVFLHKPNLQAHVEKHNTGHIPKRLFTPPSDLQFVSVLGDLLHKQELYLLFGKVGPEVDILFKNTHQAEYLTKEHPELCPPEDSAGNKPNSHTLGTYFEYYYQTNILFRSKYLIHINIHLCHSTVSPVV